MNLIPQVIERATQGSVIGYDIYSRLLKDRIIFVGGYEGEFTTDSANTLIAQLLYLAPDSKGKPLALPNSRIMIHQPMVGGISGQAADIIVEAKEMAHTRKILEEIMAKHTGQTFEKINRDMERNNYMSAEEAMKYGIIDEVIMGAKAVALKAIPNK